MTKKNFFNRLDTYLVIGIFLAYYTILFFYARFLIKDTEVVGLIISAALPFLFSILVSLYLSSETSSELETHTMEIKRHLNDLSITSNGNKIKCHGAKHGVPKKEIFWNDLLSNTKNKFILIGRTNRSWISKSKEQSTLLGDAIIKIVQSNGMVRIISENTDDVVKNTLQFFKVHVYSRIHTLRKKEAEKLLSDLKCYVLYSAIDQTSVNYAAVVSDDRLMIIPTLNSPEFRNEGMVLEIEKQYNSLEFDTYTSDVNRIFDKCNNLLEPLNEDFQIIVNEKVR